jgi:hypothetical protein
MMAEQKTTAKTAKTTAAKTTTQTSGQTVAPVKPVESPKPASPPSSDTAGNETGSGNVTSTPVATATGKPDAVSSNKPLVEHGKRLGVTLNVAVVANAFHNALASRSVRYVQYALHDRGFEPGNDQGRVDFDTRKAYAEYQKTIDESPTGVPTAYSLNILGFDVS